MVAKVGVCLAWRCDPKGLESKVPGLPWETAFIAFCSDEGTSETRSVVTRFSAAPSACSASVSGAIPGHPSFFVIFAISVCNNQIVNPGHNVRRMAIPSPSHDLQKGTMYGPSGMTAIAGSALAVTLSSTAERTESMELTPVRACWAGLKPVL